LRNARLGLGSEVRLADVVVRGERVAGIFGAGEAPGEEREADLAGLLLLPGLVNAHDHLDFSVFPLLGQPPYANAYAWAEAVRGGVDDPAAREALAVPLVDRLWLGGLRNLLSGVTAVAHHNPYHRSLGRPDFPVRVLAKYDFAHSPGLTPQLRKAYRTTDRRIPWLVHAAEGVDERCRGEVKLLAEANVLRQNTVIIHGIGIAAEDVPLIAAARAAVVWCPESNRRLFAATAPVADLRAAGIPVGLGSDSPASGVRDALSNLAAARHEGVLSDPELLTLATTESALVARLPVGGFEPGASADFVAVRDLEGLLAGDRRGLSLVVTAGRPLLGERSLLAGLGVRSAPCRVAGSERALAEPLGRRALALQKAHRAVRAAGFLADVEFRD
jgi:cytosine/adenosine deaminase-related metal-dependent hydrolase